jgi:hypothetical protein
MQTLRNSSNGQVNAETLTTEYVNWTWTCVTSNFIKFSSYLFMELKRKTIFSSWHLMVCKATCTLCDYWKKIMYGYWWTFLCHSVERYLQFLSYKNQTVLRNRLARAKELY